MAASTRRAWAPGTGRGERQASKPREAVSAASRRGDRATARLPPLSAMSACKEAGCSLPTISSCSSQPYFVVPASASTAAWRQSTVEEAMEPIPFWMLPSSCSNALRRFVCTDITKGCAEGIEIPMCRSVCQAVKDACGSMILNAMPSDAKARLQCGNVDAAWPTCAAPHSSSDTCSPPATPPLPPPVPSPPPPSPPPPRAPAGRPLRRAAAPAAAAAFATAAAGTAAIDAAAGATAAVATAAEATAARRAATADTAAARRAAAADAAAAVGATRSLIGGDRSCRRDRRVRQCGRHRARPRCRPGLLPLLCSAAATAAAVADCSGSEAQKCRRPARRRCRRRRRPQCKEYPYCTVE